MHSLILDRKREVGGPGPGIDTDSDYPGVFAYSPPGLNHTVTFNATLFALVSDGFVRIPHCLRLQCGFLDGNTQSFYAPRETLLYIQQGT